MGISIPKDAIASELAACWAALAANGFKAYCTKTAAEAAQLILDELVPDLETAMARIRNHAAPANAIRHHFKTPCVKKGVLYGLQQPPTHL